MRSLEGKVALVTGASSGIGCGVGPLVKVDADHEHGVLQYLLDGGFATVGTPDMWSMPFLFRATPRLDLTG